MVSLLYKVVPDVVQKYTRESDTPQGDEACSGMGQGPNLSGFIANEPLLYTEELTFQ